MIKFKPGDRVVVILNEKENDDYVPVGSTGTVLEYSPNPFVKMDDVSYNKYGYQDKDVAILSQNELELIGSNPAQNIPQVLTAEFIENVISEYGSTEENIQIIKDYGRQCALKALQDAAENADIINKGNAFSDSWNVDKDSILETEIITP